MKNKFSVSYLVFSGWIANLGVVPLLLFSAFLLLPILVLLAFLLFLVTLVFETMIQLLSINALSRCRHTQFNKIHNLRPYRPLVKGLIGTSLIFSTFLPHPSQAKTKNQQLRDGLTLTIGQLKKLSTPGLIKYGLGNKEIIKVKTLPKEGSLLIKGKGLGHTDLLMWFKGSSAPQKKQIFVVHKSRYMKLKELSLSLNNTSLTNEIKGQRLKVSGLINNRDDYQTLVDLYNKHGKYLDLNNLALGPQLRLEIYGQFLGILGEHSLLDVDCHLKRIYLTCKGSRDIKESLESLEDSFLFRWIDQKLFTIGHQYRITLTLQQFESSNGRAFNFGLSKVDGNLGQLLFQNPLSLIEKNSIIFKDTEFRSQTLAHPKLTGRLNHPIKVRLGQEIPFLQSVSNGVATQNWRFAGLAIDILLKAHTNRLLVTFKTNLSRPGEKGISQNLQESAVLVTPHKNQILFDIGFNIKQRNEERFPFLSKVPLFGTLFKGRATGETYKKILCLIHVEKIL